MKQFFKIIVLVSLLLLVGIPLWLFAFGGLDAWIRYHPEPGDNYLASATGSYATLGCGSRAGESNWGEQVREVISLAGTWDIAQSQSTETPPGDYDRQIAVPSFLTEADPPFLDVGNPSEHRNAYWYRTTFTAPESPRETALLCLHKARYGVKVWLNGAYLGEHFGAYSLSEYDASQAIRYGDGNELIVRVGADKTQLPEFIPSGIDLEKKRYLPGIWDDVNLILTGEDTIVNVKVEPDLSTDTAIVKSWIRNNGSAKRHFEVLHHVRRWSDGADIAKSSDVIEISPGATATLTQRINIPDVALWTPENPNLYVVHTVLQSSNGVSDDRAVRFGMRSFEWRGGDDKGFYLNGRHYYLRGSNIVFPRFEEDPERKLLPWDRDWVRRLFTTHPRDFHWNIFRTHLGQVPMFWYDIADEEGFLIADEFFLWSSFLKDADQWSIIELEKEYAARLRESWNHASIAYWDASNETNNPLLSTAVIDRVRHLDPTRAWENGGYLAPHSPGDPIDAHPYQFGNTMPFAWTARMYAWLVDLSPEVFDELDGQPHAGEKTIDGYWAPDHPYINNEYGWLWLNRDGTPTPLTQAAYGDMIGFEGRTPEEYRETYAYLVSEMTAFWRVMRGYAGVQHFAHLASFLPNAESILEKNNTSDNFLNVTDLVLEPRWHLYGQSAWAPVAVYIERWGQDFYARGEQIKLPLKLINDTYQSASASLRIMAIDADGRIISSSTTQHLSIPALGQVSESMAITLPDQEQFLLVAELDPDEKHNTVYSRRKIGMPYYHPIPDPPYIEAAQ